MASLDVTEYDFSDVPEGEFVASDGVVDTVLGPPEPLCSVLAPDRESDDSAARCPPAATTTDGAGTSAADATAESSVTVSIRCKVAVVGSSAAQAEVLGALGGAGGDGPGLNLQQINLPVRSRGGRHVTVELELWSSTESALGAFPHLKRAMLADAHLVVVAASAGDRGAVFDAPAAAREFVAEFKGSGLRPTPVFVFTKVDNFEVQEVAMWEIEELAERESLKFHYHFDTATGPKQTQQWLCEQALQHQHAQAKRGESEED